MLLTACAPTRPALPQDPQLRTTTATLWSAIHATDAWLLPSSSPMPAPIDAAHRTALTQTAQVWNTWCWRQQSHASQACEDLRQAFTEWNALQPVCARAEASMPAAVVQFTDFH